MNFWRPKEHHPVILPVLLILIGCAVALASPLLVEAVAFMGVRLRRDDIILDYLIGLVWTIALGISILFWPVPFRHKRVLVWLWIARSLVVLGFMLVFEYYYQGLDAIGYVESADAMQSFTWGGSGTERITALVWLHNQVFPGTYHAIKASFSMIGLIAVYIFYRAGMLFVQKEDVRWLYVLGLFPSILFWSSLLGKDPVVLLAIAIYCYGVVGQYRNKRWYYLVFIALGIFGASFIRPWMGFVLAAPLTALFLGSIKRLGLQIVFVVFFLSISLLTFNTFTETFHLETTEDFLQRVSTIQGDVARRAGGSTTNTTTDLTSVEGALVFLPIGIITALFRPMPGEVLNIFGLLSGIENVLLLFLTVRAAKRSRLEDVWNPIVLWMIALVLLWATFYAFATFNMGMIVRYKLQILPIMVSVIFYLDQKRPESG